MLNSQVAHPGQQGPVIGFRPATGEYDFGRDTIETFRDGFAYLFYDGFGFAALTMGGTWIAENLHRRDHGRFGFRRNRCGSCVIEVYAHVFGILRLKVMFN